MIVSRKEIIRKMQKNKIVGCADNQQLFAMAKYMVSKLINKPVKEMQAIFLPNGDVAVRSKSGERIKNEISDGS